MEQAPAKPPLLQPVLSHQPEPGHDIRDVLTFSSFLNLLRQEEDYFDGQQQKTKLIITRLRKIFYDKWGWNSQLIRGAAHIRCRYKVRIITAPEQRPVKPLKRYKHAEVQTATYRLVTYRKNDRVYGDTRAGQVPEIYQKNHQEVLLPDGTFCDLAHVLAGLDAMNHKQVVSPLPVWLSFLDRLFPHVDSNIDIVTWLGDIASSSADFLLDYLRHGRQPLTAGKEQQYIDADAPGSDMLGDIDAYVIGHAYNISTNKGERITDILKNYYLDNEQENPPRKRRFSMYCEAIGLRDWNGERFVTERQWLAYYSKQLRDNTSFQVYSLNQNGLSSLLIPLRIWFNGYKDVLKTELLLHIFLNALTALRKTENN